jgi:hypothetical protein
MALEDLVARHPWPEQPPVVPAVKWGWGMDGQRLILDTAPEAVRVVLEIGSLLGGSARTWIEHWPDAHVLCVDPWIDVARVEDRPFLTHVPELADVLVGRPDGMYEAFLAANWEFRDRITPLRGFSPEQLADVHAASVQPDVVYVDGSHVYEDVIADLATSRALFPKALLCGDDYHWPAVAAAVRYLSTIWGDEVRCEGNTFVIVRGEGRQRRSAESAMPTGPSGGSLLNSIVDKFRRPSS